MKFDRLTREELFKFGSDDDDDYDDNDDDSELCRTPETR